MKGADAPLAGVLHRRPLPPLVEADGELPRMVRRDQRSGQPHDPTKANMVQGEDQRILRAEDCCLN